MKEKLLKVAKDICKKNGWDAVCHLVGDDLKVFFKDLPVSKDGSIEETHRRLKIVFHHVGVSEIQLTEQENENFNEEGEITDRGEIAYFEDNM